MYLGPTRGGTRGGQADFRWSDVSQDKDRENYLGHSIQAPTGRWTKHRDIHWYNRDKNDQTEEEKAEAKRREIRKVKWEEENALSIALGYGPIEPLQDDGWGEKGQADDSAKPSSSKNGEVDTQKSEKEKELEKMEKEDRKREKELKRQRKEIKRIEKEMAKEAKKAARRMSNSKGSAVAHGPSSDEDRDSRDHRRRHSNSRLSRSPDFERSRSHGERHRRDREHSNEDERYRRDRNGDDRPRRGENRRPSSSPKQDFDRTRTTPPRRGHDERSDRQGPRGDRSRPRDDYDFEAERARDRARWERNHDRERGQGAGWGERSRQSDGRW